MKAKKVLHVVNEFDHVGNGIVNVACDLAYAQARAGLEVAVASLNGSYVSLVAQEGVTHYPLDLTNRSVRGVLKAQYKLGRVIEDFRPDIIHAHTMAAAVLSRLKAGTARVVCTVHNEYQKYSSLMRLGHVVVGVSDAVSNSLVERGFPAEKVKTVLNGPVGSPRENNRMVGDPPVVTDVAVVTVGMVSERKGSDLLVKAFSAVAGEFPEVDLYFIGNIHWPELVREVRAGALGSRIHFLGFSETPSDYLSEETVFVLPSRQEPFGLVILEARQAGAAIIGSSADGIPEVLDFGQAGLIFESESVYSLTHALRRVLGDKSLRSSLSKRSKTDLSRFSVQAMCENYATVYAGVLTDRNCS